MVDDGNGARCQQYVSACVFVKEKEKKEVDGRVNRADKRKKWETSYIY